MEFTEKGQEKNDPTPINIHPSIQKPESMDKRIARMVTAALSQEAAAKDMETFDEANDFDIDDPFETDFSNTKYELGEDEYPVLNDVPQDDQQSQQGVSPTESGINADGKAGHTEYGKTAGVETSPETSSGSETPFPPTNPPPEAQK